MSVGVRGEAYQGTLVQGQKVYCGLYGGRVGYIVGIDGKQSPDSIQHLGVMSFGGSANFKIIWEDGAGPSIVPESIVRGVQWEIYDQVINANAILDLIVKNEQYKADAEQAAKDLEAARQAAREKHLADNPHLTPASHADKYCGSKVAGANIRKQLKISFPGTKFSVRTDHNSVTVAWTDGPSELEVGPLVKRHESGTFDGMTDSSGWDDSNTFGQVFGEVTYAWIRREITDGTAEVVAEAYCKIYGKAFEGMNSEPFSGESLWTISRQILSANAILPGHKVTGVAFKPDYEKQWDKGQRFVLLQSPVSAEEAESKKKAKSAYPLWTAKSSLLSVGARSPDWPKEFRKDSTVAKEIAKLEKLGYQVEIKHGRRGNAMFIKLVSGPQSDEVPEVAVAPAIEVVAAEVESEVTVVDYTCWL